MHGTRISLLLLLGCVFVSCKARAPQKLNDAMTLIANYDQHGHYDDAIEVALEWMQRHPEDSLYDQVAISYLEKASKDSAHKEQWIGEAASYYEKDLSTHKKSAVDVELYNVGRGFEYAGDLSTHDSCVYYGRAVKAFEEEVQFIQGDTYTSYGHTTPLAPVRRENEKALERTKSKFGKAGCKAE